MLRVLLTNDDGIFAPGLTELARRISERCEVLVVAPVKPSSAKSQSITLHKPLRLLPMSGFDCPCANLQGIAAWACTGTPADCVMLGLHHLWKHDWPHLVISGVNDGPNVAQDTAYSGTLGGAMEGAINGVPSFAISLAHQAQMSFADAASVVERLFTQLLFNKLPADAPPFTPGPDRLDLAWTEPPGPPLDGAATYPEPTQPWPSLAMPTPCFNVNLPKVPLAEIKGIAWACCGYRRYANIVERRIDPRGQDYFWIAGERVHEEEVPGTDTHTLAQGYVSVTPLSYNQTSLADISVLQRLLERG